MVLHVKVMSCGVCHLRFLIDTKRNHQRNTPAMISVKCLKKRERSLSCGDGLLGLFLSIENPLKTHFFLNLISIEKPFVFNLNSIEKPLELNLKTFGFYLKLH